MSKWFLLLAWYACSGTGSLPTTDCNRDLRVDMPSLEVCRQVRAVNAGARCLTEDVDTSQTTAPTGTVEGFTTGSGSGTFRVVPPWHLGNDGTLTLDPKAELPVAPQ